MTTIAQVKRDIAALKSQMDGGHVREYASADERAEFKAVEYRADQVFREFGTTTAKLMEPRPAESPFEYRRRVAQRLAAETKAFRRTDIGSVPPSEFLPIEAKIYADALKQSRNPLDLKPGQLREIVKTVSGLEVHEFVTGEGRGAFKAIYGHCIAPPMGVGAPCRNLDGVPSAVPSMMG